MNIRCLGNVSIIILTFISLSCWKSKSDSEKSSSGSNVPVAAYTQNTPASNTRQQDTQISMTDSSKPKGFMSNLPAGFRNPTDDAGRLLLREYGAVFVARGGAVPPDTIVFRDQPEVSEFQASLKVSSENIGGFTLELQTPAMDALRKSIAEAKSANLSITPRDKDAARRSYDETIELWASRVDPALKHWVGNGRMTQDQADKLKALSPYEQVPEVLRLEAQGIYFAKDLSKSIIYSVAPPGTSQHLSMLAFDVNEHDNLAVRKILAKHGWYQTVISDLPHFTFLGVTESELPRLGLKKITDGGRSFWVPDYK